MKKSVSVILIVLILCQSAFACLWDYDTLAMERRQFPGALELITGKFLRHSDAFYRWRIEDRLTKLENEPENVKLLDDLAVAYDKLGQHDKAIEVTLEVKGKHPDRYETAANLGTFYIHSGDMEAGLAEIKRAIAINPEAHFGREEYQQLLVEYLLKQKVQKASGEKTYGEPTFAKHVLMEKFGDEHAYSKQARQEIKDATKGILGMMRFGNFDSPILLEALGDLWVHLPDTEDAFRRLAFRAILKASYEANGEEEQKRLKQKAGYTLGFQTSGPDEQRGLPLATIEATFQKEIAEADQWYQQVAEDEARWIEEGKDVDAEFASKYYETPTLTASVDRKKFPSVLIITATILLLIAALALYSARKQ